MILGAGIENRRDEGDNGEADGLHRNTPSDKTSREPLQLDTEAARSAQAPGATLIEGEGVTTSEGRGADTSFTRLTPQHRDASPAPSSRAESTSGTMLIDSGRAGPDNPGLTRRRAVFMLKRVAWIAIMTGAISAQACGRATAPTPVGYEGQWGGTTGEATVRFTVSGNTVTSFDLTFKLPGPCSGSLTFPDLGVVIHTLDPPVATPYDQPGFGWGSTDGTTGTLIAGHFSADRRSASGEFRLVRCGTCDVVVGGAWGASRR
jgi:hypothetical protein